MVAGLASKEKVSGQNFSLITRLPDDDTKEITLYGSAYTIVKAALFNLGRMEHAIAMRAEENVRIMMENKEAFGKVIDTVIAKPYGDVRKDSNEYEMTMRIKKHNQFRAGIKWCRSKISLVTMYGRLIGAQEEGAQLKASPEQLKIWRDSVLQLAQLPADYSSIEEDYIV
ncbi:MAG: hypothetical protein FWG19_00085 [Methanomassiliicoccaceae archaeon]|nr:hypothetical protein [Methanomassiliicoccaceae archaeon]